MPGPARQCRVAPVKRAILLAAVIGAAVTASPAAADDPGFSISLSHVNPPAVLGRSLIMRADVKNPPLSEYAYLTWLDVALLRPEAVSECPAGAQTANQLASAAGGAILTISQRIDVDDQRRYSTPVGFTPAVTGPLLVCAYTVNEVGYSKARASLTVNVQGTGPVNVALPRVKRAGTRLTCSPGRWSGGLASFAYRWKVDGKNRSSGRTLRVTRALRGHRVQCGVIASNASGSASALSPAMAIRR